MKTLNVKIMFKRVLVVLTAFFMLAGIPQPSMWAYAAEDSTEEPAEEVVEEPAEEVVEEPAEEVVEEPAEEPIAAPPTRSRLVSVQDVTGDNLEQNDEGAYLYHVLSDAARTFEISLNGELFEGDEDVNVAIKMLPYGFAIDQGSVSTLQALSEYIIKEDANNESVTFTIREGFTGVLQFEIETITKGLTEQELEYVMANGWAPAKEVSIEVSGKDGAVIAKDSISFLPRVTKRDDFIKAERKEELITGTREFANCNISYTELKDHTLREKSAPELTIRKFGDGDCDLYEIQEIRAYNPSPEKMEMYAEDSIYTSLESDGNVYTDEKGEYMVFTPKKRLLNISISSIKVPLKLRVKSSVNYLDENGGVTYSAPDTEIDYLVAGDDTVYTVECPGYTLKTLPVEYVDGYHLVATSHMKKLSDTTANKKVTAGHAVRDDGTTGTYRVVLDNNTIANGKEYRSKLRGNVTVSYIFPYEIQPISMRWSQGLNMYSLPVEESVDKIDLSITDQSGNTRTQTLTYSDFRADSVNYEIAVDLKNCLADGERVTRVDMHTNRLISYRDGGDGGSAALFAFYIPEDHEDGTPLLEGELLHFDMEAKFHEDDDNVLRQGNSHFYLQVQAPLCRKILADGSSLYSVDIDNTGSRHVADWIGFGHEPGKITRDY